MSIINQMTKHAWAMEEANLRFMAELALRHDMMKVGLAEAVDLEALERELGKPLENTQSVTVRGGVAILPLHGPIFPKANLMTRISGATSLDILARDFTTALESSDVHSIVISTDSPGGAVAGTNEMSEMVAQARGIKRIVGYVEDKCCSGALWVNSGADSIFAAPTALIGSVGVAATVVDDSKARERAGVKTIDIVSSRAPKKRLNPTSKEGRTELQAMLDDLEDIFIRALAKNRGTTVAKVENNYGQGGVMVASKALKAGMIDGITSFEDLLTVLQASQPQKHTSLPLSSPRSALSASQPEEDNQITPPATQ